MKNILLAVTGLSPQVITEAVYCLLSEGKEVDAIHVVTTRPGKERILSSLFDPDTPRLHQLLADFNLTPAAVDFTPKNIHCLANSAGVELADIISRDDNELLLHKCLELSYHFTANKDCALWFLVAGGRKTMSSCLTLAAQLYGRRQDRIVHVLVSPEFESCRNFWYPPKESIPIRLTDDQGHPFYKETRYARINLITIPFVSVRSMLPQEILDQPRPPAELMQALVRDPPFILVVNLADGKLIYGELELDLHPAHLALYGYFAERKKECRRRRPCSECHDCFAEAGDILSTTAVSDIYNKIPGSRLTTEMSDTGILSLSTENFSSYKSKIRKQLLEAFGHRHLAELEITSFGKRPDTRYGIRLDRRQIRLEW